MLTPVYAPYTASKGAKLVGNDIQGVAAPGGGLKVDDSGFALDDTIRSALGGGSWSGGYTHTQTQASDTWTIAHNLGLRPSVATFATGGLEMLGTVLHLSDNVLQISFGVPVTGLARLN